MNKPFKPEYSDIEWEYNDEHFKAWTEGRTGYPIVDAAMRQLVSTGYMHNRCRMIVASFLAKDLLLDWRLGERFFMEHLIDGDFASNNGGWGFSASTGVDPQPYFRIFNPLLQVSSRNTVLLFPFTNTVIPRVRNLIRKAYIFANGYRSYVM
jgi:deoxyribodipyrimidine photo-lyase